MPCLHSPKQNLLSSAQLESKFLFHPHFRNIHCFMVCYIIITGFHQFLFHLCFRYVRCFNVLIHALWSHYLAQQPQLIRARGQYTTFEWLVIHTENSDAMNLCFLSLLHAHIGIITARDASTTSEPYLKLLPGMLPRHLFILLCMQFQLSLWLPELFYCSSNLNIVTIWTFGNISISIMGLDIRNWETPISCGYFIFSKRPGSNLEEWGCNTTFSSSFNDHLRDEVLVLRC